MGKQVKYQEMVDKSIAAILAAIEVYNKPVFNYRDESFVILLINGWELLLKAKIAKDNHGRIETIFKKINADGKRKKKLKKQIYKTTNSGNIMTITIAECLSKLKEKSLLPEEVLRNLRALVDIRDTAIHFSFDNTEVSLSVNELGAASIQNFFYIVKEWFTRNLSDLNFFILPMSFNTPAEVAANSQKPEAEQVKNLMNYLAKEIQRPKAEGESQFAVALRYDVKYEKLKTLSALAVHNSKTGEGVPLSISDDEALKRFHYSFIDLTKKCCDLYTNFKQDKKFNDYMKTIKADANLCHSRKLNPKSVKSNSQYFYSDGVFNFFNKYYTRKS